MNWFRIIFIMLLSLYIKYTYTTEEEQFRYLMTCLMMFITLDIGKICDLLDKD